MPFLPIAPDDQQAVTRAVELYNAARVLDDPDDRVATVEVFSGYLRYGWDLDPAEYLFFVPDGGTEPTGLLSIDLPTRDNQHLVWAEITVSPDHRRRGHGSAMMAEVVRRTRQAGRTTIWVGGPEDSPSTAAFLERAGFRYASHDARRRQRLADLDPDELDRLHHRALEAATGYALERLVPPDPDDLLVEIAEVAEAINDAPMGELTFEREVIDPARLRAVEAARVGRGDRRYQVVARHRASGRLAGHSVMAVHPSQPQWGSQGNTAVVRQHRGHRLGLLLKTEMLRWLAEAEPQLVEIETWNQADNDHMIAVNEALGYRLNRVFAMYELTLGR